VDCVVETLRIRRGPRQSLEEVAREARYRALGQRLDAGEYLLTAHHQDDQAETVLLMLLRGSGLPGLAAMPRLAPLGRGLLLRPLLDWTRAALARYAAEQGLSWIEDPSNRDPRHVRNRLRREILPRLRKIQPGVSRSLARSAGHLAAAQSLLDEIADADLAACATAYDGLLAPAATVLSVGAMKRLNPARRGNLLRHWCRCAGLPAPSSRQLAQISHDLLGERPSGLAVLCWGGVELRRYRDQLALFDFPAAEFAEERWWDARVQLDLPGLSLRLAVEQSRGRGIALARLHEGLWLRPRRGGESCRLPGRDGRHVLKKLFQERGIPPWERSRLPLLYIGDELAGVAGLWTCEPFVAARDEPGLLIHPLPLRTAD
jgi:tRNA(Ile)-lysidine synthase